MNPSCIANVVWRPHLIVYSPMRLIFIKCSSILNLNYGVFVTKNNFVLWSLLLRLFIHPHLILYVYHINTIPSLLQAITWQCMSLSDITKLYYASLLQALQNWGLWFGNFTCQNNMDERKRSLSRCVYMNFRAISESPAFNKLVFL